jgi:predicted alpha/beta-fold hydrolase
MCTNLLLLVSNMPIVILQHGLCGHTYSHYMKGQPEVLTSAGLYVVSFVARGCGGVPLTTPETFTAARTSDFRAVVQYIADKYPGRKIAAVGYSLGAG